MRKFATVGALVFTLSLVGSQAVFAASPAPSAPPTPKVTTPATVTTPASHHWKATFTSGKVHGVARLTVASSYASGALHLHISGLKKGDKISVALEAQGKSATKTIVTRRRTATAASGILDFSFRLSRTQAREIRTAVKAGDVLVLQFTDGSLTASGTFARS